MRRENGWLYGGLFLTTLATLLLEILDSRLLSILTWYHLAFLAISVAMLGMSAGAVLVFLGGERFRGAGARRALGRSATAFALSVALCHLVNLTVPVPVIRSLLPMEVASLAVTTAFLALPFFLSGVVVTLALTRVGSRIGLLYGCDLLGAAAGCVLIVPLLDLYDITSAALIVAATAAGGAWCFSNLVDSPRPWRVPAALFAVLVAGAALNAASEDRLGILFTKEKYLRADWAARSWSNAHSYVIAVHPNRGGPPYWGPGRGAGGVVVESTGLVIDGDAGTAMTRWNGDVGSLGWVQYDVTSLPYHLRRGNAAVIGVGGGRDLLTALWGGSKVTGIEVNGIFVDLLTGPERGYAGLAGRDDVRILHDEARSYLSRTGETFDVIQMSLTDTWASTGAGAFTLSENGLYTLEAWDTFLARLAPGGLLSVSRWFAENDVSETSRLLSLAVATLLERGVAEPSRHLVLLSSGPVATLLVSNEPFPARDLAKIREIALRYGFGIRVFPGATPERKRLERIITSRSSEDLARATDHPHYDYSPPSDDRPFFFNILKPTSFHRVAELKGFGVGGVVFGNSRATTTLVALFGITLCLVLAIIFTPLLRSGLPSMAAGTFAGALAYFALIGVGFMLVQVPLLQRFSVYLGHPSYTLPVILFSMILFAGCGSLVSDRLELEGRRFHVAIPVAVAASLALLVMVLQPVFDATLHFGLPLRALLVVVLTAPTAFFAGFCFPFGMRMVSRVSDEATAWMWGVNGACSVLASILAVGTSLWAGIHASLLLGALAYGALAAVAWRLEAATRAPG